MGCQPGSLYPHGLGDKAVTVSCSCGFHLHNGTEAFSQPDSLLSAPHSEREGEEIETETETFSSQLQAQPGCPGLYFHLRAKCNTICHFLLIDALPSAPHSYPLHRLHLPHLFPTASHHSLHPVSIDHFPHLLPAKPTAVTSFPDLPSFSTHGPPFPLPRLTSAPSSTPQAWLHALPTKCNSLGQPESLCPRSPHPFIALCFIFLDLISCPSFPSQPSYSSLKNFCF